jgi:hypothetical protein
MVVTDERDLRKAIDVRECFAKRAKRSLCIVATVSAWARDAGVRGGIDDCLRCG